MGHFRKRTSVYTDMLEEECRRLRGDQEMSIPGRITLALVVSLLALVVTLFYIAPPSFHSHASNQPELPGPFPGLGIYSNVIKQSCGKQGANGARWNPKDIPFIGCFGLSSGNSVTGRLAGRQVEFAVDEMGRENCKVDGVVVVRTVRQRTNVPNVIWGCEHLTFCVDEERIDCTTSVTIISHNSDKSVYFQIAQRVGISGYKYLNNQENWDFIKQKCGEKTRCPPWI
jgi:hypothetical protein